VKTRFYMKSFDHAQISPGLRALPGIFPFALLYNWIMRRI
jgi:hypothetical protein